MDLEANELQSQEVTGVSLLPVPAVVLSPFFPSREQFYCLPFWNGFRFFRNSIRVNQKPKRPVDDLAHEMDLWHMRTDIDCPSTTEFQVHWGQWHHKSSASHDIITLLHVAEHHMTSLHTTEYCWLEVQQAVQSIQTIPKNLNTVQVCYQIQ